MNPAPRLMHNLGEFAHLTYDWDVKQWSWTNLDVATLLINHLSASPLQTDSQVWSERWIDMPFSHDFLLWELTENLPFRTVHRLHDILKSKVTVFAPCLLGIPSIFQKAASSLASLQSYAPLSNLLAPWNLSYSYFSFRCRFLSSPFQ